MNKSLFTLLNFIFPFADFLYILQLEEYDNKRYVLRIPRFYFKRNIQKRDTLKFTSRIQTTFILSVGLFVISLVFILFTPFSVLISLLAIPIFISLANNLLTPFYEFMKYRVQNKASKKVKAVKNLKVIAIAGSYGKTTTKNFLFELIRFNYKTQMVPGNINTPTGIAAWVLKNLSPYTELLLVEMDTYFVGEIARSCFVTPPDIAVITSIGDQHIERFGSQNKMARAISEVFTKAKPNAKLFTFDSEYKKLNSYSIRFNNNVHIVKNKPTSMKTNLESKTTKIDLAMAIEVAHTVEIEPAIIRDTIKHLIPPDRRQQPTEMSGYTVIDDSYNISATTAREGVSAAKTLARKKKRKLLVVTAGIPELAPDKKEENRLYGEYLQKNADYVIVLKSVFWHDIHRTGFLTAKNMPDAWNTISQFSPKDIVLLLQPELTDLYY